MTYHYESMLRATDATSLIALLREFQAEAQNVLAHLQAIEDSCEQEQAKHAA